MKFDTFLIHPRPSHSRGSHSSSTSSSSTPDHEDTRFTKPSKIIIKVHRGQYLTQMASTTSYIQSLSDELKLCVIDCLGVKDVKNLRLTCREWAGKGVKGLFKLGTLTLWPHVDDMTRLQEISMRPWLARYIRCIDIYPGDWNQKIFESAIRRTTPRKLEKSRRVSSLRQSLNNYRGRHCNRDILSTAFKSLPNLTAVLINSNDAPFSEKYRVTAWGDRTTEHYPQTLDHEVAGIRYMDILTAMATIPSPLSQLRLDYLPLKRMLMRAVDQTSFKIEEALKMTVILDCQSMMEKSGASLWALSLTIGDGAQGYYTSPELAQALAMSLASMRHLRLLSLVWREGNECESRFTTWMRTLYDTHWPFLESLAFENMKTPDRYLTKLLMNHTKTLKELRLDTTSVVLSHGNTFRHFLTEIRNNLSLAAFRLHFNQEMNEGQYDKFNTTPYATNVFLLDLFVRGMVEWPMTEDNPDVNDVWIPTAKSAELTMANVELAQGDAHTSSTSVPAL